MIRYIQNNQGFLLLIFIIAVVLASLAMTTAFFNVSVVEAQRKEVWTWQKMMTARERLGERFFQISSESGTDICFINEEKGFPANINDFVNNGYLKDQGLTSAGFPAKKDAWNDDLIMDSSAGRYRVRSSNLSKNLSVVENLYTAVDVIVLVKDLTDSSGTGDDMLDDTYVDITASGLYDMDGSLVKLFAYPGINPGEFLLSNVSIGCYELRITENPVVGPPVNWMQDRLGAGITSIRSVIIIYPMDNAGGKIISKTVVFPWDVKT